MKKIILLLIMTFSFANMVYSAPAVDYGGWMEYAVVLQPTGSTEKDITLLEGARRKIAMTAMSYLGTPYVWAGEGKGGYDCSGFIKTVYGRFGIALPRVLLNRVRLELQ